MDLGSADFGPFPDLRRLPDVLEGDPLVLVDEEDAELGGLDDLLDLVLAQVLIHPGFLVQAMGLIDDQCVERVGLRVGVRAGVPEEVGDVGLLEGPGELALVDGAGRRVPGHVLGDQSV